MQITSLKLLLSIALNVKDDLVGRWFYLSICCSYIRGRYL